ncbi:hypothetical protein I7I50_05776 [Histoplasma capsulatum G186AR]|nr:hypothetical protein I7I52_04035 [Histoplasma capsulatum]QSS76357.1 hypothetical protein I7I50_05776 [Histoplasma capsulatum G186AR]
MLYCPWTTLHASCFYLASCSEVHVHVAGELMQRETFMVEDVSKAYTGSAAILSYLRPILLRELYSPKRPYDRLAVFRTKTWTPETANDFWIEIFEHLDSNNDRKGADKTSFEDEVGLTILPGDTFTFLELLDHWNRQGWNFEEVSLGAAILEWAVYKYLV